MRYRPAEVADAEKMADWSISTPHNGLDPDIASYPLLYTFAVEDENGPLLYIPTHPVLMVESVAARPDITGRQYIEALLQAKAATEEHARGLNIREIYTSSSYTPMQKTISRHGYRPITGIYRKKIK